MIVCKKANTKEEEKEVFKFLFILKPKSCLVIYGYWKEDICVGATWLDANFPHNLSMECHEKSFGILKAIAESYKDLFKTYKVLTAKIQINNFSSNKIAIQLGWNLIYTYDNYNVYEIIKESWKHNKKYPVV